MIRAEFAAMGMLVDRPHPDRVRPCGTVWPKRDAYLNQLAAWNRWCSRRIKNFVTQRQRSFQAMLKGQARSQVNHT